MKSFVVAGLAIALSAGSAIAGGTHKHSHDQAGSDGQGQMMAIGMPGDAAKATRTIEVVMLEKDDGSMVFEPAGIQVKAGETVQFHIVNKGELAHEFVMDGHEANMAHKKAMEKYPDMEHADPNAIRLEPGASGDIYWTFSKAGPFEYACLIPGHYEAGMKGELDVGTKTASN